MTKDTLTSSRSNYSNIYDASYVAPKRHGCEIKPLRINKSTLESRQKKAEKKLWMRFNIEGNKSKKKALALLLLRASKFAFLSLTLPFAYLLFKWPHALLQENIKFFEKF